MLSESIFYRSSMYLCLTGLSFIGHVKAEHNLHIWCMITDLYPDTYIAKAAQYNILLSYVTAYALTQRNCKDERGQTWDKCFCISSVWQFGTLLHLIIQICVQDLNSVNIAIFTILWDIWHWDKLHPSQGFLAWRRRPIRRAIIRPDKLKWEKRLIGLFFYFSWQPNSYFHEHIKIS